jgi:predicted amidophosphoribosyltransferase
MLPTLPAGTIIVTPPQGASTGTFAAGMIADTVSATIGAPHVPRCIERTYRKRHRGWRYTRKQKPFRVSLTDRPALALVIDDLATTGTTLRMTVEALRREGIAALGFCYA